MSISRLAATVVTLSVAILPLSSFSKDAEWTIMVYMNAKNNLEPDALTNYHDMAEIGSTDDVNIVVEMGRPEKIRYSHRDGDWYGVKRFLVKKNSSPVPGEALMDVGASGESIDMGNTGTLTRFMTWAKQKYPAKRYMLIIWNHGQGWRFQLVQTPEIRIAASKGRGAAAAHALNGQTVRTVGNYRSVSQDEDTGSILFNSDVQAALSDAFPSSRKLDLLGFDACLMAMIETAYAFSPNVMTLVASEELEPGLGWHYAPWIKTLVDKPTLSGEQLAIGVVDAYKNRYANNGLETLSVMRLADVRHVAAQLSALATAISQKGKPEIDALLKARQRLTSYGRDAGMKTSVDLVTLLEQYEKATANATLRAQSSALRAAIAAQVAKNYASTQSANPNNEWLPNGSRGLAIYFPGSKADYDSDPERDGYRKDNTIKPVEFVKRETWADLLFQALGLK